MTKPTGLKFDGSKAPLDLIPREHLEGVASVLAQGAVKYGRHNWRGGIVYSRLIAAALRHISAFNDGEDLDPETGLSHVHHAAANLAFLAHFIATRPELDDRYAKTTAQETVSEKQCVPCQGDCAT